MANIISTFGTTEGFVKSALMGLGATQQNPNGRFYLDGNMVNVELSQVIAEAMYIEDIFRNGQSVTSKYTVDREAGAVRVMLDTPFDMTSRTLGYGGRSGTPGNSGVINVNPPLLPTNDEFFVYLNQLNDQAMIFADVAKELVPLDVMAKKLAGYAKSVVQDRSGSTLAEILSYSVFRALNQGDNINNIADLDADNAYGKLLNAINTKLDNGDIASGAYTFSTEGRTIIGRPNFINKVFNKNSGVILTGSDLAQSMLRNYDLDADISNRDYVGTNYKGKFGQFHFQSAPDYIWTLAERYLGLAAGALDNVYAVAVSFEATAMGAITDLGVKLIDANEVRGIKAQPLNKWGHETFRKCQLIGPSGLTADSLTALGFSNTAKKDVIAPKAANARNQVSVPLYGTDGSIIGYQVVAEGLKPNGGNFSSGLATVETPVASIKGGSYIGAQSVTLSSGTSGTTIYYTLDGTIPTSQSAKYTAAISITTGTKTLKAIAIKTGVMPSAIMSETYVIA